MTGRKKGEKKFGKYGIVPRLFSALYLRGGSPEKKNFSLKSQLLPLATFVPSLGQVGQCAWELGLPNSRKCHFFSDPCVF